MEENKINISVPIPTPVAAQATEVTPNIPNPGDKLRFSVKTITSIIIFLLLAGGAAASFTVLRPQIVSLVSKPSPTPSLTSPTPTPNLTLNWKTYTNAIFNVYFKYPAGWSPDRGSETHGTESLQFFGEPDGNMDKSARDGMNINFTSPLEYTPKQTFMRQIDLTCDESEKERVEKEIQTFFVDGHEAASLISSCSQVKGKQIFISNSPYMIILQGWNASQSNTETLDQILSTLKFIEVFNCGTQTIDEYYPTPTERVHEDYIQLQCFIEKTKSCSPAKLTSKGTATFKEAYLIEQVVTGTEIYEIRKGNKNECELSITAKDYKTVLSNTTPKEQREELESKLKNYNNAEGICIFPNSGDLTESFLMMSRHEYSFWHTPEDEWKSKATCSGKYFDITNPEN